MHASNLRAVMHSAVQHDGDNRRGEGCGDNRQVYASYFSILDIWSRNLDPHDLSVLIENR